MHGLTENSLQDFLNSDEITFPNEPPVVRVEVAFPYWDDESIIVWLIVPDGTPEQKMDWRAIEPVVEVIRNSLRTAGFDVWPVVKVRTESEFTEST